MSGCKFTAFSLAVLAAATFAALSAARNRSAAVDGLRKRISSLLEESSEGLQATFADEVRRASVWLERRDVPDVRDLGMHSGQDEIRRTRETLDRIAAEGQQVQQALTVAFTRKADHMGKELAGKLAELEGHYADGEQVLRLWFAPDEMETVESTLRQIRQLLMDERYTGLPQRLEEIAGDLARKIRWAREQEDKHQKRLYVLKALRQVCTEMGFQEVAAPTYEHEGDRGSRIHLTVDTVDRGQIAFSLGLEGISSFSQIADDRCFEEFGQLSQYLEKEFGVLTAFRLAEEEPLPRLKHKGEMDLPEDAGMQAEAS